MEEENYEIRINKKRKEEIERSFKVVDLLNEFWNAALKNEYSPLVIHEDVKFIIFELTEFKNINIRDTLEEENPFSLESFCSMVFQILFLSPKYFKFDNLNEKSKCFKNIIKNINSNEDINEEKEISSKYKTKNQKYELMYEVFVKKLNLNIWVIYV